MNNDKTILPVDFDGLFRFTNWTDRESKHKWNSVEYTFPPLKTVPMIISGASPEQTQYIRKKFAKELAEREFFRSDAVKAIDQKNVGVNNFRAALGYEEKDLEKFTQRCLEPLELSRATAQVITSVPVATSEFSKVLDKDSDSLLQNTVPVVG